jgi:hypothetical protein
MPKSKNAVAGISQVPSIHSKTQLGCIKQHHYHNEYIRYHVHSYIRHIRTRIPRRIGVNITGILDLAHRGSTTTNATTEVSAAASVHDVERKCRDERDPAEPEEGAGSLCLAAVLLGVCRRVADAVGVGVCLSSLDHDYEEEMTNTYGVRAAMCAEVCGERDGRAEAEQHAQSIEDGVDDGNAEFVDEGGGNEVEEGEEPPDADEEGVVDDGVGAVCCAVDVVGHEGCDEESADELFTLDDSSILAWMLTYLPGTEAHGEYSRHHICGCMCSMEDVMEQ